MDDPRAQRTPFQSAPRSATDFRASGDAIVGATAAEMAQHRFGGPTRLDSRPITLTTTWQQIIGANPRRVFWSLINRGVVNGAVDIDPAATFANGIPIGAAGGFVQSDVEEDGESVAWAVFGACESGTAVCRLIEIMRV